MTTDTYTCASCHGTFTKTVPDDEAMKETHEKFGPVPQKDCDVLCDECFKQFLVWLEKTQRSN